MTPIQSLAFALHGIYNSIVFITIDYIQGIDAAIHLLEINNETTNIVDFSEIWDAYTRANGSLDLTEVS